LEHPDLLALMVRTEPVVSAVHQETVVSLAHVDHLELVDQADLEAEMETAVHPELLETRENQVHLV